MKPHTKKRFLHAGLLGLAFVLFTVFVCFFDVRPIGPEGSTVGFAAVNRWAFRLLGVHPGWHVLTDLIGMFALLPALSFALVGLCQLVKRKSLCKVDRQILALGFFYLLVLCVYLLFERVVINCRPVLVDGLPEASYPSSHTMLVVCVLTTAAMQIRQRFPARKGLCLGAELAAGLLCSATAVGRLLSGMHWLTDVVGGLLASAALVALYGALQES